MINIKESPKLENVEYYFGSGKHKVLKDFYSRLENNRNINNLDYFFHNLRTLRMDAVDKEEMSDKDRLAEYSVEYNFIRYIPKEFLIAIAHELLHLASSIRTDDCQFSGFSQLHKESNTLIGIGLNEGYTCILDDRYFSDFAEGKKEYLENSYLVVKHIAGMIEDLVGQENMERSYFNADLKSLVEYLNQFMDYDEVICFLLAIDNIYYYCDNGKVVKPHLAMFNYKYVVEFIGRCYINILTKRLMDKEISQEKYDELMGYVYDIMSQKLKFKRFKILNARKMSKRKFNHIVTYEQNKVLKKYI